MCPAELLEEGKIPHTEIEEVKVKIYQQDQVTARLISVGFQNLRTIRAFDQDSNPSDQDEYIVYECSK